MAFQVPKDIQEKLNNFEQLKSQLQMIMSQRGEMEARKKEIDASIEALENSKDSDVFRKVGEILIKVNDTKSLLDELKEDSETLGVRVSSMESQEKSVKELYETLGKELNEALKG
jgi:prefoldin beta subunit